jgi:hypothetical protein
MCLLVILYVPFMYWLFMFFFFLWTSYLQFLISELVDLKSPNMNAGGARYSKSNDIYISIYICVVHRPIYRVMCHTRLRLLLYATSMKTVRN